MQHQLLPRLSVFGGYFHRHFYNQEAQQNPLLTSADWTPFQVANPLGNGETITLFNLNPAKAGQYASQLIDVNSDINRTIYDGFEVSFTARLPRRSIVFGGWSNDRADHGHLRSVRSEQAALLRPDRQDVPGIRQDVDAAVPERLQAGGQLPAGVGHRSQRRVHELRGQGQQLHRAGSVARRLLVGAGHRRSRTVSGRAS